MKKRILNFFVIFFICSLVMTAQEVTTGKDVAVTNTENGKVRGYIENGIFTYKGIPYAKAERFEASVKPIPGKEFVVPLCMVPLLH
ncbi:hypothetical protein NYZ99_03345 [Maribacter litopenaei]|uniref:Carboxylesterase family protein n=1 Tax=Maribacter litopenaei TaxID=2976127 RepID=A0ABY5YB52_9FLAO|nr:hypothetical protein [Maribacter litopenaei]UWX55547.1 hypothetical protein NYZ99_03345 [Maribacter litopenaei]